MGACACCITIFSPPQYDIPLPETHNYTYNTDLRGIVKLNGQWGAFQFGGEL